jgi:uncharacterized protein YecE (DUF72 family)
MSRPPTIRIGTSGWIYPHWRGRFYPADLPNKRQLAYIGQRFPTVEINGTFYSMQRPEYFDRWRSEVPGDFVFAVKGSRYLTHMLKLKNPATPLANFFAMGVLRLGAQLGPILWQLPPQLRFNEEKLRTFLELLPRDMREAERLARRHDARVEGRAALEAPDGRDLPIRHCFEVREDSWCSDEAFEVLERHDAGFVVADTAGKFPLCFARTAKEFVYVRLHGSTALYQSRYSDEELDDWAAWVHSWAADGQDVYVYFDNDDKAYAADDALRLMDRVPTAARAGTAPPERLTGAEQRARKASPKSKGGKAFDSPRRHALTFAEAAAPEPWPIPRSNFAPLGGYTFGTSPDRAVS